MKKQAIRSFTILGLLLVVTAVSVRAQSERSKVTNIPFSFIVGEKTLPAGEYTIEPNRRDYDKVWLVQSREGHANAVVITIPTRAFEIQEKGKLVFRKYGDMYFLSQIWTAGGNSGRELLIPRLKHEVAKTTIDRQTIVLAIGFRACVETRLANYDSDTERGITTWRVSAAPIYLQCQR
jgi:hypothetical protein